MRVNASGYFVWEDNDLHTEQQETEARHAVFFDRDGTLIFDRGYMSSPDQVEAIPGAVEVLCELSRRGYLLVVVSNQSGIGRGWISEGEAEAVAERFRDVFAGQGIRFDGIYHCPHAPGAGCFCRKPKPGMLLQAASDLRIELGASFMVGDKFSDCEAAEAAGCRAVLLAPGGEMKEKVPETWMVIRNLSEILGLLDKPV